MGVYTILNNLIMLGVVGLILTLFRKSDKSSKSLEQVKKYASKRNEEFDLYVEDKIAQLKDLSVSIEVQEKTGAVILNKISDEVDLLSEKIEHIEELNKKVLSYNSTMDKMLNLSKELDERYGILKKDSTYLDSVDKKVKEGNKKLVAIEKNIDDIASEFIKNNNHSINKIKDEVLHKATNEISELEKMLGISTKELNRLDNQVSELKYCYENISKENFDKFKEDLNRLVESHRTNIIKITSEGESLEEASFSELKNKIEIRSNNILSILEDKLRNIEDENRDKISKVTMDMGNIEVIANKIKDENKERLDSIKSQIDNQLLMLKEVNIKGVSNLQDEFNINFKEFKDLSLSEINKTKNESDILISEIHNRLKEAKDYRDEVVNKISGVEDFVGNEISYIKDRIESSITEINNELDNHENKIKKAAFHQLESNLSIYKDEFEEKLEELKDVKESVFDVKNHIKKDIDNVKNSLEQELNEVTNIVKADKEQIIIDLSDFKEKLNKKAIENFEIINSQKEIFKESCESLKSSQLTLSEDLKRNEEEVREQVSLQRDRLLENVNNDINNKLESFKEETLIKINSLSNFEDKIDSAKLELESYIESRTMSIEDEITNYHNNLTKKIDNEKELFTDFIQDFNSSKVSLEEDITKLKEKSYNNVSQKLNLFEDEYFSKLKEKEDLINIETDKWKVKLDDSINKIQLESINSIVNNMEETNSKVNIFKEKLNNDFVTFRDDVENKIEVVISDMQNKENAILIESKQIKINVENELSLLKDQFDLLNKEISETSNKLKENVNKINLEQEQYINETEIFTRTDKLRDELRQSIELLTTQINDVEEKSNYIKITNDKLSGLRTLIDTINTQVEHIDGSRIKIESLENRVDKVLELSDSVDKKIISIKASEEQVVEIQLRLRELKELEESVSQEFNRLEKKEGLLDETNKSIDSGFDHIQIIENRLDLLNESLTPFNNQIDNIKEKLIRIENKEIQVNKAIDTLSKLDNSINDMEVKIEKMDKAREWIAGVETRLNESVRTADEQVKLMGALAQNKNSETKKSSDQSAPNMNMRDMVIKLAHNGWKPEDIARTTKLSRGEVELILELSPRK